MSKEGGGYSLSWTTKKDRKVQHNISERTKELVLSLSKGKSKIRPADMEKENPLLLETKVQQWRRPLLRVFLRTGRRARERLGNSASGLRLGEKKRQSAIRKSFGWPVYEQNQQKRGSHQIHDLAKGRGKKNKPDAGKEGGKRGGGFNLFQKNTSSSRGKVTRTHLVAI